MAGNKSFPLQESVKVLQNNSNSVLYYSEDQTFPGPISVAALRVDTAHFGKLKIDKVRSWQGHYFRLVSLISTTLAV